MGNLTENLSRHEFACECGCGFDTVDFVLINIIQASADYFARKHGRDVRIDITGPNRCRSHNDKLRELFVQSGGKYGAKTAKKSQHIYGRAADYMMFFRDTNEQIPAKEVYEYLDKKYGNKIALGLYVNRCHIDTRTNAGQRWGIGV